MTWMLEVVSAKYGLFFHENVDYRVRNWMLMSPLSCVTIMILYMYFVKVLGPKLMKHRKPLNLNNLMIFYNGCQVLFNLYLVRAAAILISKNLGTIHCSIPDYTDSPYGMFEAFSTYLYYISKVVDLLDTVFMVLRKKFNQITFLHVYHHTIMVFIGWLFTAYSPGGHVIYFGIINCFVHVIMYSYYLVTALYPEYGRSAWWKKHLTQMQMVQFVLITTHSLVVALNPNCSFPKVFLPICLPQGVIMFVMFWDFYNKAYNKKKINEKVD